MDNSDQHDMHKNLLERVERLEAEMDALKGRLSRVEGQPVERVETPAVERKVAPSKKMPSLEDALRKQKMEATKQFEKGEKGAAAGGVNPTAKFTGTGAYKVKSSIPNAGTESHEISRPPWMCAAPKPAWDIKGVLRKLNLLPPTADGNVEAQIGQWWISRIGAFLFVIGAVLGVAYLTRNMSPVVRFAELLTGSVAVTALGWRLEKRVPKFGAIIFGMGLALVFFTMFAGHVFEAVRVFETALGGALAQFVVVAGIVGIGVRRESKVLASMAVFLGYVAAFFSMAGGLDNYALVASVMLSVAAGCLYVWQGWAWPFFSAIIGGYLLLLVMTVKWAFIGDAPDYFWQACAWPLGQMMLFGVCDAGAKWRGKLMHRWARRAAQVLNTSGALVVGFALMMTYTQFENHISSFYFVFGGVLVAGAVAYWSVWKTDVLMHVYFVKGSALVTLGLMTEFDSRTRWAALALESLVLLFSAKRSRLKIVEGAMGLVWLASFIFFAQEIVEPGYVLMRPADTWGFAWSGSLYVLISAVFLSLQARWLGEDRALVPCRETFRNPRGLLNGVYAAVLGTAGMLLAWGSVGEAWLPLMALGVAAALAGLALVMRHWSSWAAGILPLVMAHGALWSMEAGEPELNGMLWLNGAVLAWFTLHLAIWLNGIAVEKGKKAEMVGASGLFVLGTLAVQVVFFKTLSLEAQLLGGVVFGIAIVCASLIPKMKEVARYGSLPLIWALAFVFSAAARSNPVGLDVTQEPTMVWMSLCGTLAWFGLPEIWKLLGRDLYPEEKESSWDWLHTGLTVATGLTGLCLLFKGPELQLAFGGALAVMGVLSVMLKKASGWQASMIFLIAAFVQFCRVAENGVFNTDNLYLWGTIGVAALTIAYAVATEHVGLKIDRRVREGMEWLGGLAALVMLFGVFYLRRASLESYVTVLWGVSAFTVLAAGFAGRVRGLRFLALAAFAMCIGRAFIVDIQETVARIWAFLALGASLLVVGYLYTQFKDKLIPPASTNGDGAENERASE